MDLLDWVIVICNFVILLAAIYNKHMMDEHEKEHKKRIKEALNIASR